MSGERNPEREEKQKAERPKRKADKKSDVGSARSVHKDSVGEEKNKSAPESPQSAIRLGPSKSPPPVGGKTFKNTVVKNTSEIEHPTSEIIEPLTTHNSQLTTMEVHHHPNLHHQPKPWKEYLLEGLMIFLAVTMGFFAENLRESITDGRKVHEYMQSMVSDLRSDTTSYKTSIDFNREYGKMIDTIINSVNTNKNDKMKVYVMARTLTMGASIISPNAKTFEQMKSGGAMRLVSDQRVADSIASYYQWVKKFDYWSDLQRQRINDLCNVNDKIFNAATFYDIAQQLQNPGKAIVNLKSKTNFISSDPVAINSVLMRYQYYYGMLNIMNKNAAMAASQAAILIKLLKKEYQLENE
jgi:hypothetical protein